MAVSVLIIGIVQGPSVVKADTILITNGTMIGDRLEVAFSVSGERGLMLSAAGPGSSNAPFSFSGILGYPDDFNRASDQLRGQGTATILFEWGVDAPDQWFGRGVHFEFQPAAPVPEPTSLLLIGSDLTGLALRHRRTRRHKPS